MSYDDTSFYGDLICEEYDSQNNPLNPPSPFGFFIYNIVGGTFDSMSNMTSQFMNDCSILTCQDSLINYYGRLWNLPRPTIEERPLTDTEYRVYLYLRKCRLITIQDLQICFNQCMGLDDYEVKISKVEPDKLTVVDHTQYLGNSDVSVSNIQANLLDSGADKITDRSSDEDYNTLKSRTGHNYNLQVIVEVPSQDWSQSFLDLLMTFVSVKGNVIVQEYHL